MASPAFSIKERMSPIPRMRLAARSGWNGSSASNFSPTPTNFKGCPVTWRMERAPPPRASPSILADAGLALQQHWLAHPRGEKQRGAQWLVGQVVGGVKGAQQRADVRELLRQP